MLCSFDMTLEVILSDALFYLLLFYFTYASSPPVDLPTLEVISTHCHIVELSEVVSRESRVIFDFLQLGYRF
jgi:hypothetical protein